MKCYRTLGESTQYLLEIKHSRFIATAVPIADYDEGLRQIAAIKKQYADATHNCYAMVADSDGMQCKYSDDGEPSGTAGAPMLEVLKRKDLRHVLVVVTRYFGGIKLGANGLVGAYTQAVAEALQQSRTVTMVYSAFLQARVSYEIVGKVPKTVAAQGGVVLGVDYASDAMVRCVVPSQQARGLCQALVQLSKGEADILQTNEDYYQYDDNGDR